MRAPKKFELQYFHRSLPVVWKIYEEFSFNGPFVATAWQPAWVKVWRKGPHRLHVSTIGSDTQNRPIAETERLRRLTNTPANASDQPLVTSLKRSFFPTTNSQAVEIDCFSVSARLLLSNELL
jgi:hypothetical protein